MSKRGLLAGFFLVGFAVALRVIAAPMSERTYPERPIRFILGFPAGGAADIVARAIGQKLYESWGQQVVVDNRPGATGTIAGELTAKASPDGYTMLVASSSYLNYAVIKQKMPFDLVRDFTRISKMVSMPHIAVINPSFPANSIRELVAYVKSRPGEVNYASSGVGTNAHMAAELLKMMANIDMLQVPYKGTPPALIDLIAGRVQLMLAPAPPALPYTRVGKLRALAVTSAKRSPKLPDVPAIAETIPGYEVITWYGLLAPAGTPKAIVSKFNAEVARILRTPDVLKILSDAGFDADGSTPEEFTAYMKSEIAKWTKVIKAANIKAD